MVYHVPELAGPDEIRQLEWLWNFVLAFLVFAAGNALYKVHSVGQPLLGIVSESIIAAARVSLLNYIRKQGWDKEIRRSK